jgi:integrase
VRRIHRAGGADPADERKVDREAGTFAELANDYIEKHATKRKRSWTEDYRLLYGSEQKKKTGKRPHIPLVNRWGHLKVKEMNRRGIREVLDEIVERAPVMANRTLALVRKMFNFAIEHDWLEANPCHMIKRPGEEKQRDRVLSENELRLVWTALDAGSPLIAALFRVRLLTAQRGREVHGAAWSEIDLPNRLVDDSG